MPKPTHRPRLECLEDRSLPATFGVPWPGGEHLTLSFAPDGTHLGEGDSQLFQLLGNPAGHAAWQREVLRAFQSWIVHGHLNLGVIADAGQAFGTPGAIQGDARFGDIRIGARPLCPTVLAISTPFDLLNTWSGDILVNSNHPIGVGSDSGYDLFSVLLQEAGHVLGIGNSTSPDSPMYEQYLGVRAGLTGDDIAALQALYGPRPQDRFEGLTGNDFQASAAPILFVKNASQVAANPEPNGKPFVAVGDLTSLSDVDWYQYKTEKNTRSFTVQLRTSGMSLLTARVSIVDASGRVLKSVASTDPLSGNLTLTLQSALPKTTYYVRVERAADDVFGIGGYELAVGSKTPVTQVLATMRVGRLMYEGAGDDRFEDAVDLVPSAAPTAGLVDYEHRAGLTGRNDRDYYRLVVPGLPGNGTHAMSVLTWSSDPTKLNPLIAVYDAAGQRLQASDVAQADGMHAVEVSSVQAGQAYYLEVSAAESSQTGQGLYALHVGFRSASLESQVFAVGLLDESQTEQLWSVTVERSLLFHFDFATEWMSTAVQADVTLTIWNADRQEVFEMVVGAGASGSGDVLLGPGTYTLRIGASTQKKKDALPLLLFQLCGCIRSDPTGLSPSDSTSDPVGGGSSSGGSSPPGETTDYTVFMTLLSPTSSPWWR